VIRQRLGLRGGDVLSAEHRVVNGWVDAVGDRT